MEVYGVLWATGDKQKRRDMVDSQEVRKFKFTTMVVYRGL